MAWWGRVGRGGGGEGLSVNGRLSLGKGAGHGTGHCLKGQSQVWGGEGSRPASRKAEGWGLKRGCCQGRERGRPHTASHHRSQKVPSV